MDQATERPAGESGRAFPVSFGGVCERRTPPTRFCGILFLTAFSNVSGNSRSSVEFFPVSCGCLSRFLSRRFRSLRIRRTGARCRPTSERPRSICRWKIRAAVFSGRCPSYAFAGIGGVPNYAACGREKGDGSGRGRRKRRPSEIYDDPQRSGCRTFERLRSGAAGFSDVFRGLRKRIVSERH